MKPTTPIRKALVSLALAGTLVAVAATLPASADFITSDPSLPPVGGHYQVSEGDHARYAGPLGPIILSTVVHKGFRDIRRREEGPDEVETFDSTVFATLTAGPVGPMPITLEGEVSVKTFGKVGHVTGTFPTEMLSLDLEGTVDLGIFGVHTIEIRESPTLVSPGLTGITDIGMGLFKISSFFDVFTELSVDGGPFVRDQEGPATVNLVPGPATLALLGLGAAGLVVRSRMLRRRPR